MEKQTKILLGIGAVIAAYLILKSKKTINNYDELICPSGFKLGGYGRNQNGAYGECVIFQTIGNTTSVFKSEPAKINPNFGKVIKDGVLVEVDCNNLDKNTIGLFSQGNSHYSGGIPPSPQTEKDYADTRKKAMKKINELGLTKCFNEWTKEEQKNDRSYLYQ
jgi:hypothetical protein